MNLEKHRYPLFVLLILKLSIIDSSSATRQVMVVTSIEEHFDEIPKVIEIFDFTSRTWRAVEKSIGPLDPDENRNQRTALLKRPGTARLVENNDVFQYELSDGMSRKLATYPEKVEGATVLEYGDTVCLIGGYDPIKKQVRRTVHCWNPLAMEIDLNGSNKTSSGWVALPPMIAGRYRPGAVVMDGKMFVVGGYDPTTHEFLSSMEVFDDVTQKWYTGANLSGSRAALKLVALDGKLYAIGGWKGHKYMNSVEEYNLILNRWQPKASLKTPRARFGAVTKDGNIFVVGGVKGFKNSDSLKNMEVYDPSKNEWANVKPSMNIIKGPVRATLVNDII